MERLNPRSGCSPLHAGPLRFIEKTQEASFAISGLASKQPHRYFRTNRLHGPADLERFYAPNYR